MTLSNRQVLLASRPDRKSSVSNFTLRDSQVVMPAAGEVLVRNHYLSIDPWLRPLMNNPALLPLDTVVPGDAVGGVVASEHPFFRPGDMVQGLLGWQHYATAPWYLLREIDPYVAPISTALGVLGLTGLTAYVGLSDVGRLEPGETVVVSAAAGAVGSTAAQLAKLAGCRVIGIAGSEEKVTYLTQELGLDAAVNYKSGAEWRSRLAVQSPFGVDVYFDNVGGRVSDAVLPVLNAKARVIVCGQIASYDRHAPPSRLPWLGLVLEKRIRVEGFLVSDFSARFGEALQALSIAWRTGMLRSRETTSLGLEQAPDAFIGLLQGANLGKQIVKVV